MMRPLISAIVLCFLAAVFSAAQTPATLRAKQGSESAKQGFKNEAEIASRFEAWRSDADARGWLMAMGYNIEEVTKVTATRPHGDKADVVIRVTAGEAEYDERISIKLVSSSSGFNQIDKRWVSDYAAKWKMPLEVSDALRLFVGEKLPETKGRRADRAYLDEFDAVLQQKIIWFFTDQKLKIVRDMIAGEGEGSADWFMVALRGSGGERWAIRNIEETVAYFAEGAVAITRSGNLRIGKVTMQRKGGDGGRNTAKMLQFKLNPALLFEIP